nr:S41 family peptidase [Paenibacillus caui]
MYNLIKDNYPFLKVNQRLTRVDWLANKDIYIRLVKATQNDDDFFNMLNQILTDLHNDHTHVLGADEYWWTKEANEHADDPSVRPWLKELNKPVVVSRYSRSKSSTSSSQNIFSAATSSKVMTEIIQENKVAYLYIPSLMNTQLKVDKEVITPFLEQVHNYETLIIDIRGNGGGVSAYWENYMVPMLINQPVDWSLYLLYRGGAFSKPFIEANLGDHIDRLKPIRELRSEHLPKLPPEAFTDFKTYEKRVNVIKPNHSIGFQGKIYLLVDQGVYSSSEMWAYFAQQTKWATVVGDKTGGDGLSWGGSYAALPNSGYIFRLQLTFGLKYDGSADDEVKTTPDIFAPGPRVSPLTDDPAVQAVLKAEAERLGK